MPRHIFGITGEISSGKGAASDRLKAYYGPTTGYTRFSIPLGKALDVFYLPQTRENLQDISTDLRQRFGEDLLARTIAKDCEAYTGDVMIVDGVRRFADIVMLNEMPGFRLIYVTAPVDVRFARARARAEKVGEGQVTWEKFLERDQAEAEREIPAVGAKAHLRIDNIGTLADLHRQVDAFLKEAA